MRILQLIDSLEPGGAERMAVNYANALIGCTSFSGLAATRKEGDLKSQLQSGVSYLFLNRKTTFDVSALFRLRKFVKENQVNIVHAHSSSFLLAVVLKLVYPKIKVVWHDHNGNRVLNNKTDNNVIKWCSYFFNGVITVNLELEKWAKQNLKAAKVLYIPNFTTASKNESKQTVLKGQDGKRIICLANLHDPKNHITLLKAFSQLNIFEEGWTLHLIGKDKEDVYSDNIKQFIKTESLQKRVFIYGSCPDVFHVLSQAEIGVLCSTYEGFPVTLLEYGLSNLAVVSTNVGYCPEIIKENERGLLISPLDINSITEAFKIMISEKTFRNEMANNLNVFVSANYSEKGIVKKAIEFYSKL